MLELRKKLSSTKISESATVVPSNSCSVTVVPSNNCSKHNELQIVYCETCRKIICRDCTISKEHNTHNYQLISECYPQHSQQLQDNLDLVKRNVDDIKSAVTYLATREDKVLQQGEQLKKEINTHAQEVISQIQRSCTHLLQQVDTSVQQKKNFLTEHRRKAQELHDQLNACKDKIEHSLKEWSEQQILIGKEKLIIEMSTATQNVNPREFFLIELDYTEFQKCSAYSAIGQIITTSMFKKSSLTTSPCLLSQPGIAKLELQSEYGLPFALPLSFISCTLFSPGVDRPPVKCDITQTHPGEYSVTFTPSTKHDQLAVQVEGVNIPNSPFSLPVISLPGARGEPLFTKHIEGLVQPLGIGLFNNGDMVVVEGAGHCITILNNEGKKIKTFGQLKTGVQFNYPQGVAISIDGHILVTDEHRLQKLTTEGICVKSVGKSRSGSGRQQFNDPKGIAVHPKTGQIFVADSKNNRIQIFNNDLSPASTLHYKSQLASPNDIAIDDDGNLYVVEFDTNCITKLTPTGKIAKFLCGQLNRPSSVTVRNNVVYVTVWGQSEVAMFNAGGKFLHSFGDKELNAPSGITADALGQKLYITDTYNNRIVVT